MADVPKCTKTFKLNNGQATLWLGPWGCMLTILGH